MSRPTDTPSGRQASRALPERATDAQALALVEARKLCQRSHADLAEGRCPASELHGGHSGPCHPRVEYRAKGVGVALQTPAGHEADKAWHSYWREHDYRTRDVELRAGAPPAPTHEYDEWVWFSWARLGRLHRDELAAADQLQLAFE
jgi:hypothetical protein